MNELIDILNGGNKEELKAFLNLYSKPIYERALALRNDKEEARACAKRTMAQVVRLAKQSRLSYDIDAQLMYITDICCDDAAYEKMLLGDMVEEVLAQSDGEEAAIGTEAQPPQAEQAAPAKDTAFAAEQPRSVEPAPVIVRQRSSAEAVSATLDESEDVKPAVVPFVPREAAPREAAPTATPLDEVMKLASMETAQELEFIAPEGGERAQRANSAKKAAVKPLPREIEAELESEIEDDIFAADEDDTFSPAAQRRARREAKKRDKEEKRRAAKEATTDMYDLDLPDEEDNDELLLFGEDGEMQGKRKKARAPRAKRNDFLDDEEEYSNDDEEQRVSPGMVVLIFVLAVIVVLFVWILIVKLSTMGVINMSDFGFADWFNKNIFKLY